MNSSFATSKQNETLLLRKVASYSAPPNAEASQNRTAKLRRSIERRVRNRDVDDHSLQVFVRLMKASQFFNSERETPDSKRPLAPPASPIQSVQINESILSKTPGLRSRLSQTANGVRDYETKVNSPIPSSVAVNAWTDTSCRDAWLVMRGKNIRLKHQEHVRNAMTTPRLIQSACGTAVKSNQSHPHQATISPYIRSKLINGKFDRDQSVTQDSDYGQINWPITYPRRPASRAVSSFVRNTRSQLGRKKSKSSRENYQNLPQTTPVCELSKSIVIKIPQPSKPSR